MPGRGRFGFDGVGATAGVGPVPKPEGASAGGGPGGATGGAVGGGGSVGSVGWSLTAADRSATPGSAAALHLLADEVEGAARPEPLDLLGGEGLDRLEVDGGAVGLGDPARHVALRLQVGEAQDRDAVVLADLVVGGRVGEGQGQHALL